MDSDCLKLWWWFTNNSLAEVIGPQGNFPAGTATMTQSAAYATVLDIKIEVSPTFVLSAGEPRRNQ